MLTTKYIRDNASAIRTSLEKRRSGYRFDELLGLDAAARRLTTDLQRLQAERNKETIAVSEKKKKGESAEGEISALKIVKESIGRIEGELGAYQKRIDELLWGIPNVLDESVPTGMPPEGNKTLKKWGEPKEKKTGTHEGILAKLGMLDMEAAARVAGSRFYYLKGDLVLLEQSLSRYALDFLSKRGYIPVLPPFMLRKSYYKGVAPLTVFQDALYKATESDEAKGERGIEHIEDELFMIGTAEHPLAAMHSDTTFAGKELPLRYAGISPCFRREAGAHGQDQKGIFRVHQFDKVEQFIFCRQEDEAKCFDELLRNSEEIWQSLGIPYRTVLLCSGDTGHQMARSVDIEGWFPGQGAYRELGTCSTAKEWQSVRLDIKYDDGGERRYVYTLNNTAISVQRSLACIVENYVNDDGTITVPDALVPYIGKGRIGR